MGKKPYEIAKLGVGYVPDDRRIFADLTAEENLEMARRLAKKTEGPWTIEKVYKLFPVLEGLRASKGTYPQRRRTEDAGDRPGPDEKPRNSSPG